MNPNRRTHNVALPPERSMASEKPGSLRSKNYNIRLENKRVIPK